MRYRKLIAAYLFFCTLSVSITLFAQTSTGEVNGTVTDASGAAIPGASIKLTNKATQIVTTATSNESGQYFIIHVQPGAYSLKIDKDGFSSVQIGQLQIGVNQT